MRDKRTRLHFIVSIAVHVLILLIWTGTESYLERRERKVEVLGRWENGQRARVIVGTVAKHDYLTARAARLGAEILAERERQKAQ